ncbi:MAG: IS982 family transposase [Geobacteraceae bacterium]|nr:IS982 family transposase [Geobacteraceae bacterium]
MDTQIVAVFCLCDDMLKALNHYEDPQCQMNDAEVMTTAIVAALRFRGNFELARQFLQEEGYIPNMLGKSRFNRRLHRVQELFLTLFHLLGETWKELNSQSIYVIDSYPIAACDNYRICRSRRYQGEIWRGRQASKRRFFYGLKIHIMVTEHGQPVEFFLTPGSMSDASAYRLYDFDLPPQAWITGDKAYTDYDVEDAINETGIRMRPIRKKNSKRPFEPWIFYLQSTYRKIVETTGSLIERLLPKSIHSVTPQGFELKVGLFVLAASLNFLW